VGTQKLTKEHVFRMMMGAGKQSRKGYKKPLLPIRRRSASTSKTRDTRSQNKNNNMAEDGGVSGLTPKINLQNTDSNDEGEMAPDTMTPFQTMFPGIGPVVIAEADQGLFGSSLNQEEGS
jgi:hypothetical protein